MRVEARQDLYTHHLDSSITGLIPCERLGITGVIPHARRDMNRVHIYHQGPGITELITYLGPVTTYTYLTLNYSTRYHRTISSYGVLIVGLVPILGPQVPVFNHEQYRTNLWFCQNPSIARLNHHRGLVGPILR
jgi:hypothetical protein